MGRSALTDAPHGAAAEDLPGPWNGLVAGSTSLWTGLGTGVVSDL